MVKLKAIQIAGFQSWKNCTVNFSDGLNVICAPNNTGKSVLFKCIQLVAYPDAFTKDEKVSMIRNDCERASALFLFSDDSAALVFIYPKGNIYFYADKFEGAKTKWEDKAFKPQPKLIANLGLILEPSNGFIANMLSLKHDLFLIESDSKANNDLIKALTQHDQLTRLCEVFRDKLPEVEKKFAEAYEVVEIYKKSLSNYEYIDVNALEEDTNEYELYFNIFEEMCYIYKEIEDLNSLVLPSIDLQTCVDILEITNLFEDINEYLELDKNKIKTNLNIIETIITLEEIYDNIESIQITETVEDAKVNLIVYDTLNSVIQIYNNLIEYSNQTDSYNKLSKSLEEYKFNLDSYNSLVELEYLVNDLNALVDEYNKSTEDCRNIKESLETLKSKYKSYKCPIHGKIILTEENECVPIIEE